MKPMPRRMLIMGLCVVLMIAALGLTKFLQIRQMIANSPKPGPQTVSAIKVEALEWQPQFNAVGTLTPVRGVDVTTEVSGLVRNVRFRSGQDVEQGQVLVELNADADVALLHSLQAMADLAASVLARDKLQFDAQAVSQAQLDADEADLRVKRANVAQQAALVAKLTIRAPFTGRLGITTVNPGQHLNPGDKIVTLQTIDPIYVDFTLPERQLASVSLGQHVTLSSDAFPGQSFDGKVTALNPKVDAATRNIQLEATVANDKHQLLPGMFARVYVDAGDQVRYPTLPLTAVTYNAYGSTVFVLKPGTTKDEPGATKDKRGAAQLEAQQVFVTTGSTRGDQVAVLTGVTAGDLVVTSGQLKLKNGTPVVVDNSIQPANSPNPTPQEQ